MNPDSFTGKRIRPLRARQRDAARDAILDAAEAIIADRGLHGAAMGEIAARAGVAVGTVYNHFEDRDSLVRALFRARRAVISPEIVKLAASMAGLPFERRLRGFVTGVLEMLEQHRLFVRVALEAEQVRSEPPSRPGSPVMTALGAATLDILTAGAADGVVAAADAERLVRLLLGGMRGLLRHRLDGTGTFREDADLLVDVFLGGVRGARPARG